MMTYCIIMNMVRFSIMRYSFNIYWRGFQCKRFLTYSKFSGLVFLIVCRKQWTSSLKRSSAPDGWLAYNFSPVHPHVFEWLNSLFSMSLFYTVFPSTASNSNIVPQKWAIKMLFYYTVKGVAAFGNEVTDSLGQKRPALPRQITSPQNLPSCT